MRNKLEVTVRATEKNGEWEVTEGIMYRGIQVDIGDITDGASIPLLLQVFLKKGGPLFTPSVIHDIGYRKGLLTRVLVDNIFYEAMKDNKVPRWKRKMIYQGVRLFGSKHYKGDN